MSETDIKLPPFDRFVVSEPTRSIVRAQVALTSVRIDETGDGGRRLEVSDGGKVIALDIDRACAQHLAKLLGGGE